jgi:Ca2+-binding EF-hand superfamily protein
MSFTDFRQFLINLSLLSKKKAPSFPVCQDMFDFIDLKKDGIIDLDEWVQSFARYEVSFNPKTKQNTSLL